MTSEQPPRDALRPLRPLPSIDVPLLRDERTALRSRRFVQIGLGIVLVSSVGVLGFLAKRGDQMSEGSEAEPSEPTGEPAAEPAAAVLPSLPDMPEAPSAAAPEAPALPLAAAALGLPPPLLRGPARAEFSFGNALSFRDAIERAGLSHEESSELIGALETVMDFRRSHATDTFVLQRDAESELERFEYRASLTQRYEAVRGDGGKLRGRQVEVPIRTQRVARGGVVRGSLGDTFDGLKLSRSLAGVFSEVFDGQINFSTETRSGDTFRVLYDEEYVEDSFLRAGSAIAIEYKGEKCGLHQAFWHGLPGTDGDFYDATGRALHGGWLRTPLRYDHVSSGYGMRMHPVLKRKKLHNGIDYAAATGTQVRAAAHGTVVFAGPKGPNGNLLIISHPHGYETFYAHLSRFAPGIKAGSKVSQRQLVAYVGSTGRSTGPHLHFSLKRAGTIINPATQLNGPGLPMPTKDMTEYKKRVRDLSAQLAKIPCQEPTVVAPAIAPPSPTDELGEEEL